VSRQFTALNNIESRRTVLLPKTCHFPVKSSELWTYNFSNYFQLSDLLKLLTLHSVWLVTRINCPSQCSFNLDGSSGRHAHPTNFLS
ncbi:hypothetical protein BT69DRAFT_1291472, partial [Atractiella rhizophila]